MAVKGANEVTNLLNDVIDSKDSKGVDNEVWIEIIKHPGLIFRWYCSHLPFGI